MRKMRKALSPYKNKGLRRLQRKYGKCGHENAENAADRLSVTPNLICSHLVTKSAGGGGGSSIVVEVLGMLLVKPAPSFLRPESSAVERAKTGNCQSRKRRLMERTSLESQDCYSEVESCRGIRF